MAKLQKLSLPHWIDRTFTLRSAAAHQVIEEGRKPIDTVRDRCIDRSDLPWR
jgi:hypothetical protein